MKILLADANAVDRKLATTLLEQHGHTVVVAGNRGEALGALEKENCDLVFMDVRAREMDGLGTIRATRAREQRTGIHLTIIALTAQGAKEKQKRCLEAGADDCLLSPIRAPELLAILDALQRLKTGAHFTVAPPAERSAPGAVDIAAALERVEGDRDLLDELIRLFAEECPKNMTAIREAWEARDARLLERLAHTVKGSAAHFGAARVSEAAFALEKQAHSGDLENASEQIRTLEKEVEQLLPELESLLRRVTH